METWAWLAAYLGGFALLQLVLYRYFWRGDSRGDGPRRTGDHTGAGIDAAPETGTDTTRRDSDARSGPEAGITCQHCGAVNEAESTFTYCRRCAQQLQ